MGTIGGYDFFRGAQGNMRTATNAAAASAINDVPLKDGELIYVSTFRAFFALRKGSSTTADGVTVLATLSGTARLERLPVPHPSWLRQATWYVDPVNGNDEWDATSATFTSGTTGPIKTLDELGRRLNDQPINIAMIVYVASTTLSTDEGFLSFDFTGNGSLSLHGIRTVVFSGTLSAKVNLDATTRTSVQATSTWTSAQLDQLVRLTSGANAGASAWYLKDLGSGAARLTPWLLAAETYSPSTVAAEVNAAGTETIETYTLPQISKMTLRASSTYGTGLFTRIFISDLNFQGTASAGVRNNCTIAAVGGIQLVRCDVSSRLRILEGNINIQSCRLTHACLAATAVAVGQIAACAIRASLSIARGNYLTLQNNTTSQDFPLMTVGPGAVLTVITACGFDWPAGQSLLSYTSTAGDITGAVFGSSAGAGCIGINAKSGANVAYTAVPNIACASGSEFQVGGDTSVRPFDDTAGSFATAIATTWANLAAATPAGFGGRCMNHKNGAVIGLRSA